MKRKLVMLLLAVVLILALASTALAATSRTAEQMANDLKGWGLFKGVSETDFALYREPTRTEAVVMLIRALGQEQTALNGSWSHPFTDVPVWAEKYIGYAYENKLTNGIGATRFGNASVASANMYLTFMLRALGYDDAAGDFTWSDPLALAEQVGLLDGVLVDTDNFLRKDVVLVSYYALDAYLKGTSTQLCTKLGVDMSKHGAAISADYQLLADFFSIDILEICATVDGGNIGLALFNMPANFDFNNVQSQIDKGELKKYLNSSTDGEEAFYLYYLDVLEVYMAPYFK